MKYDNARHKKILDILMIDTLDTQNRDSLDFHDISVETIKELIDAVYVMGYNDALHESANNPVN